MLANIKLEEKGGFSLNVSHLKPQIWSEFCESHGKCETWQVVNKIDCMFNHRNVFLSLLESKA